MRNRYITEECNKILNFWKLEEYFTPSDYPELTLTIKEGKQDILFDAYYNAYSTRSLPLKEYKAHNEYLSKKHKSDEKLYNRANVYCGCYKIKTFVEKMAEKSKLDMEKYAEINELSGRFYIFSVQIDLDGKLTEEAKAAIEILEQYAKTFQERNPNLYLFNCVMHLDEATPHLHIDYIPVANGYKTGMKTRNSLTKALQQMGFAKAVSKKENETVAWQQRERTY